MRCEDVRKRLKAWLDDDVEGSERTAIQDHLGSCPDCARVAGQLDRLSGVLHAWKAEEPAGDLYGRVRASMGFRESPWRKLLTPAFAGKTAFRFAEAAAVALITLAVSGYFRRPAPALPEDDSAAINFYVTEHREAVLQAVSSGSADRQPARMTVNRGDVVYYEFIDDFGRISRPGVIVRVPSPGGDDNETAPKSDFSIAKPLTPTQARAAAGFEPVAPARIHPGYILDKITKVEGRESLHLLYTNGIDTFSVFEQPLGGNRGLAAKDFREYAVYKSPTPAGGAEDQGGTTILAWKNSHVAFVLIGRADMSRLMEIAQAFADARRSMNGSGD